MVGPNSELFPTLLAHVIWSRLDPSRPHSDAREAIHSVPPSHILRESDGRILDRGYYKGHKGVGSLTILLAHFRAPLGGANDKRPLS